MGRHERTLPGAPDSVAAARTWVATVLHTHDCDDDAVATAQQVVSELATNAVRHTASGAPDGTFDVTVEVTADTVRVQVRDKGTPRAEPVVCSPGPEDLSGRGLWLVRRLCLDMGVLGDIDGRGVFADVLRQPTRLARADAIGNLRRSLEVKGLPFALEEAHGRVTVHGAHRHVVLTAGQDAWQSSVPGLAMPFGNEWVIAGWLHTLLREPAPPDAATPH